MEIIVSISIFIIGFAFGLIAQHATIIGGLRKEGYDITYDITNQVGYGRWIVSKIKKERI